MTEYQRGLQEGVLIGRNLYSPKHGHWVKIFETEDDLTAKCSECGMVYTLGKGRSPNYCGTCGAKMDEVKND